MKNPKVKFRKFVSEKILEIKIRKFVNEKS